MFGAIDQRGPTLYQIRKLIGSLANSDFRAAGAKAGSSEDELVKEAPRERRLRDSLAFVDAKDNSIGLDAPYAWPEPGDVLLRPPVGDEEFVYGLEQWVVNDLKRLDHYANQYRDTARELVSVWLYGHRNPEAFAYTIGYLYRHAIELRLKSMMTHDSGFRAASDKSRATMMLEHHLSPLWQRIKPTFNDVIVATEATIIEIHLVALDSLDENSVGFRYPFRFAKDQAGKFGVRVATMGALSSMSFDNFVWILDGIYNWLETTEDGFMRLEEHEQEIAAGFNGP